MRVIQVDIEKSRMIENFPALKYVRTKHLLLMMLAIHVGLAFVLSEYYDAEAFEICKSLLLISVLWSCAWFDLLEQIIPNRILVVGLIIRGGVLALECFIIPESILYVVFSSIIAAVGLFVTAMLCRLLVPDSVGFGDVKLLAVVGLYLGVEKTWNVIMVTMIMLFFVSICLLATKKAKRDTEIPFAPFLLVGTILAGFLMGV
jgi:prepilin signal peptidase PulO-like enzyme (type II secretory pathway)